jgi:hypothetical protein
MADLPQMNRRLATRPIDPKRRLPIPYAQLVNPDGTANFAAIDGPKALEPVEGLRFRAMDRS